ncbi:MAG: tyrosine-type recombinase/integrase, partial [Intestinibacillus sp.]
NLLDNHIRPVIGGYPLGKISTSQLQQMLNQAVQDKGQSIRMAEGIRTTLKQIFGFACQNDILKSNPADNTKILRSQNTAKRVRKQQKALSIEERSHLLQALEGESILYPAIIMLLFTGMRVGELLALQWQHIALDTKTVTIEQALVRRHETDRAGKLQKELHMVDAPKTESSYRTLRLPEIVISALQAWKTYAKETLHLELQPEAYVFCNSKTGKLRTYTGFRSSYYHFLDRHQLDRSRFHFHALRHTFATMLLEGGIQPKIAQEILGHASVTTTLNIYSHVVPEVLTGVASMLDDIHESMTQGTYTPKISVEKT